MMTAQQYLLNQAEHCRRTAEDASDPFVAEELSRLAQEFEEKARQAQLGERLRAVRAAPMEASP